MKSKKQSLFSNNHPEQIAIKELSKVIANLDNLGHSAPNTVQSVKEFTHAFEKGIRSIFSLKENEFRCYWLFSSDTRKYDYITWYKDLNQHDKHIIDDSLGYHKLRKYKDNLQKDYEDYDAYEHAYIRNEGKFKIALVVFILKDGILNDGIKKQFEFATSSLMLLGQVDGMRQSMVKVEAR